MVFIEKLFGVAPDGGSGVLEVLLFVLPLAGIGIVRHLRERFRRECATSEWQN